MHLKSAPGSDAPPSADQPWHEPGAAFVAPVPADPALAAVPPPGSLAGAPLAWSRAARYGADDPAWSRLHRVDDDRRVVEDVLAQGRHAEAPGDGDRVRRWRERCIAVT